MLPFDQQIQNLNSSEPSNQFSYNLPTALGYPNASLPWNMDYSNMQSLPYYPSSNYYFMPNPEFQGLDELKEANQPTRPSERVQAVVDNPIKQIQVAPREEVAVIEKPLDAKARQKYGRNIISNIFHMTMKKLLSPQFSKLIERVIQINKMIITLHEFRQRVQAKSKSMKSYINLKAIKLLLIGKPIGATKLDIQFRRLLRILCRIYNHNYHIPHIYHTGKIKKQSRGLHLECLRKLAQKNKK